MKVGVLSFAHVHAAGYAALLRGMPGVEVVTSDPEAGSAPPGEVRGEALAAQLGVEHVASYQELFDRGPDAVIVAAENARHRPLVELAAKHGVDVLCEKPLATTEEDGEAMVAACREAGVRLGVAYPVRFSPAYAALRDAVRGGGTGRVLSVAGANNGRLPADSRAWFTDPQLAGGGALMDHTVHIADLLDELFGADVHAEEVYAQTNNLMYGADGVRVETAGLVTVRYSNGAVATIDCSWSHPDHHPTWGGLELQLVGEHATVEMDAFGQVVSGFDEKQRTGVLLPWGSDLDAAMVRAFLYGSQGSGAGRGGGQDDGLDEVQDDGLDEGRDPVRVADGEAGLRSLRIALAGYASARSGRPVRLARPDGRE